MSQSRMVLALELQDNHPIKAVDNPVTNLHEYFGTFMIASFDPEKAKLVMMTAGILDGSVKNATEGVFSNHITGIHTFATAVNLKDKTEENTPYVEEVKQVSFSFDELEALPIEGFQMLKGMVLIFQFINDISEMLTNDMKSIGMTVDDLSRDTQEFLQGNPFTLNEKYEKPDVARESKPGLISQLDMMKNLNSETLKPETSDDSIYVRMTKTLHANLNNEDKYQSADITYTTDQFTPDNNPFHDFITNLRAEKADPEMAFYQLAGSLKKHCGPQA